MTERFICLDINLAGVQLDKAEKIRRRVGARIPKRGSFYFHDEDRWSALIGGERDALERIAETHVTGKVIEVDGIYAGGINISAKVSPEEAQRLRQDPSYCVSIDVALPPHKL